MNCSWSPALVCAGGNKVRLVSTQISILRVWMNSSSQRDEQQQQQFTKEFTEG